MVPTKQSEPPKIAFPCESYSIKVVGRKTADYAAWVIDCVQQHAADLTPESVDVIDSKNGNFQSIRLFICAQSEQQLRSIHKDLMDSGRVQMVI